MQRNISVHDEGWRVAVADSLELSEPIPDHQWAPMRETIAYKRAEKDPSDIRELADHFERLLDSFGRPAKSRRTSKAVEQPVAQPNSKWDNFDALAECIAQLADFSGEVVAVRETWGGDVLKPDAARELLQSLSDSNLLERFASDESAADKLLSPALEKIAPQPHPSQAASFKTLNTALNVLARLKPYEGAPISRNVQRPQNWSLKPYQKPARSRKNLMTEVLALNPSDRTRVLEHCHWLAEKLQSKFAIVEGVLVFKPGGGATFAYPYYTENCTLSLMNWAAMSLGERFRWSQSEALTYLLLGKTPNIQGNFGVVATFETSAVAPALGRIVLSVDPAASPKDVRDAFALERAKFLPHHRRLSPKHRMLAVFIGTIEFGSARSWQERMDNWNDSVVREPSWRYANVAIFQRDAMVARRRVLGTQSRREDRDE